jgi:ABC-type Zn uptake system ZnuABC Zn-binding protein ZnuA
LSPVRLVTTLLGLLGCFGLLNAGPVLGGEASPELDVVVSIQPLQMLVAEVGGERVSVHTLVPPGASPHTFEPKPSDMVRVAHADWLWLVGGGLDDWAARLASQAPGMTEISRLTTLFDGADEASADDTRHVGDPHYWLDPIEVRDRIVPFVAGRLMALHPDDAGYFASRAKSFQTRLTALDREVRESIAAAPGRRYVAFHGAWRRFAARYDLEEVAVIHEFAGEEPTPKELAFLVRSARRAGVPAILVEPQLDPRIARTIGAEFGATTRLVDPLGDPDTPERSTYEALMRFNAVAFVAAVGK